MTESKTNKSIDNDDVDFSHWQLPDVTENKTDAPSNLFGYQGHQNPPAPSEDKPLLPPTMAEIEQIRVEAEQEGFEQGKIEGHSQGLEQGKLEGLELGHAEGFAQGEQQGYEVGQVKLDEVLERLTQLVQQFEQPLMLLDAEIEAEVLTLAINLAKSIVGHELKTHPEHILSVLRQGVDSLPIKEQQVKLRLHPDDATLVMQLYSDAQLQKNHWDIEADPSLNPGDCIINSMRSSVDLRVEERMRQVLHDLQEQASGIQANVQTIKTEHPQYTTEVVDELPKINDIDARAQDVEHAETSADSVNKASVNDSGMLADDASNETATHDDVSAQAKENTQDDNQELISQSEQPSDQQQSLNPNDLAKDTQLDSATQLDTDEGDNNVKPSTSVTQ
ncbi:flagellar assembly protein FliH [Shewanella olleyana]|uniref:flagellar assembly protein FliH n=1 Tax=Shewanella olleyana TaxID=135626 RepID=UPI00200F4E4A|nr:flagellar assembly protein FliH [Shewanella olleyana]MCL1066547.1 flagellar assembly protein FliH [Shewanella olleyana]